MEPAVIYSVTETGAQMWKPQRMLSEVSSTFKVDYSLAHSL